MTSPGTSPDRGYVLHSYPYRETSLLLQLWTEKHGRFAAVAKGARRPKSASRGVLVPFQPLSITWFGRGEVKTLKSAEPAGAALPQVYKPEQLTPVQLQARNAVSTLRDSVAAAGGALSRLGADVPTTSLQVRL